MQHIKFGHSTIKKISLFSYVQYDILYALNTSLSILESILYKKVLSFRLLDTPDILTYYNRRKVHLPDSRSLLLPSAYQSPRIFYNIPLCNVLALESQRGLPTSGGC